MELLIIVCLFLIINFYFFSILPKHNEKHYNPEHYEADLKNLHEVISRAKNKASLKMCCNAVYDFQKRNREDLSAENDVNDLIAHIDRRWLEIKTGAKFSITN